MRFNSFIVCTLYGAAKRSLLFHKHPTIYAIASIKIECRQIIFLLFGFGFIDHSDTFEEHYFLRNQQFVIEINANERLSTQENWCSLSKMSCMFSTRACSFIAYIFHNTCYCVHTNTFDFHLQNVVHLYACVCCVLFACCVDFIGCVVVKRLNRLRDLITLA